MDKTAQLSDNGSELAPVLPPDIPCYFLPIDKAGATEYQPVLIGAAKLHYDDPKRNLTETQEVLWITRLGEGPTPVDWSQAERTDKSLSELEKTAEDGFRFASLPSEAAKAKSYAAWQKSFATWLFQTQQLSLLKSPSLDTTSRPGESERDFRVRLGQAAREERDRIAEALKQKYAPKLAALAERKRRAEVAVEQQKNQKNQAFLQTAMSVGAGLLTAFMSRKAISATSVSKAATAARQAGRSWQEMQDVEHAGEALAQVNQQVAALQAEFESELAGQQSKLDPQTEQFETVGIRLKKTNIEVRLVGLGWRAV